MAFDFEDVLVQKRRRYSKTDAGGDLTDIDDSRGGSFAVTVKWPRLRARARVTVLSAAAVSGPARQAIASNKLPGFKWSSFQVGRTNNVHCHLQLVRVCRPVFAAVAAGAISYADAMARQFYNNVIAIDDCYFRFCADYTVLLGSRVRAHSFDVAMSRAVDCLVLVRALLSVPERRLRWRKGPQ